MGRYAMTEAEATIQSGTNRFMNYVAESRAQGKDEPYWHWSERQHYNSEFHEKAVSNFMWVKWGMR